MLRLRDGKANTGVRHEERETLDRIGGIQRHVGTASLVDSDEADDEFDGAVETDRNHILGLRAATHQNPGEAIGETIQFVEGELDVLAGQG